MPESQRLTLPSDVELIRLAIPLILANMAVPILGLADTAVIGHFGTVEELSAIALGTMIFNFVFWTFGFLRMGTTALVAQASGARNAIEVRTSLARGLSIAVSIGALLLLLNGPILRIALYAFPADSEVHAAAMRYYRYRILGAPASLSLFVLFGGLIGLGKTRKVFTLQLLMSGLNLALNLILGAALAMGIEGIALGTTLAEWTALGLGLRMVYRFLESERSVDEPFVDRTSLRDGGALLRTMRAHTDILIRTFFLLLGFGYFTRIGAGFGAVPLAANHLLLQIISLSAFFLDGFANLTEAIVGRAVGARDVSHFIAASKRTTRLAFFTAVGLASLALLAGPYFLLVLSEHREVTALATRYLPFVAVYLLFAVFAFQLDGIFLGALFTRSLRNAAIVSSIAFIMLSWPLIDFYENAGLWTAFVLYALLRMASLLLALRWELPRFRRGADRG